MTPIELVLKRLDRIFQTGPHDWNARCPAHLDKSPSLHVTARPDGVVLLYCHAGCQNSDILDAIGLDFKHLYPRRTGTGFSPRVFGAPERLKRYRPSDEVLILAIRKCTGPALLNRAKLCAATQASQAAIAMQTNNDWIVAYDKRLSECQT